jgi:hypothetical protein
LVAIYRFDGNTAVPAAYIGTPSPDIAPANHPANRVRVVWAGPAGRHAIRVRYRDESDGAATLVLRVDSKEITRFKLDAQSDAFEDRTIQGVMLQPSSSVELLAYRDRGEYVVIESIEIGGKVFGPADLTLENFRKGNTEGVATVSTASAGGPFLWRDGSAGQPRDGAFQPQEFTWMDPAGSTLAITTHDIDEKGNIWFTGPKRKIAMLKLERFAPGGTPLYADMPELFDAPAITGEIIRLRYDAVTDRMVLLTLTREPERSFELHGFDTWSSRPAAPTWTSRLPYIDNPGGGTRVADVEPVAISVEPEHAFIAYEKGLDGVSAGVVLVKQASTGADVGLIQPNSNVHHGGWVDMNHGIQTHRRVDGTYVVCVEDDGLAKTVVHFWKPDP